MQNGPHKFSELKKILTSLRTEIEKENGRNFRGYFSSLKQNAEIPHRCKFNDQRYPRIEYRFCRDDYNKLTDGEGKLSIDPYKLKDHHALTRLLYSVAWKNGDLHKIQHIIDGIKDGLERLEPPNESSSDQRTNGLVFYAFGKYLADRKNPIIDQHTIRAYRLIDSDSDDDMLKRINDTKVSSDSISDYSNWLSSKRVNDANEMYELDKIMFTVGKYAKWIAI